MLISSIKPAAIVWSFVSNGTVSVETDIRLSNEKPAEATRILITDFPLYEEPYLKIQAIWATPQSVRIAALLGLIRGVSDEGSPSISYTASAMPAGHSVEVHGRRAGDADWDYALGGASLTGTTKQLSDETVASWLVLNDTLEDLVGLQWRIKLSEDGSPTTGSVLTYLDIGEAFIAAAVDVKARSGAYTEQLVETTEKTWTLAAQLHKVERRCYRQIDLTLAADTEAVSKLGGLAQGMDFRRLADKLSRGRGGAVISQWYDESGVYDNDVLHANACFGVFEAKQLTHVERRYYSHGFTVRELPPLYPPEA